MGKEKSSSKIVRAIEGEQALSQRVHAQQHYIRPAASDDPAIENLRYEATIEDNLRDLVAMYGVDLAAPDGWRNLALSLAIEHLPRWQLDLSAFPDKRTVPEHLASRMAVMLEPNDSGQVRSRGESEAAVVKEREEDFAIVEHFTPPDRFKKKGWAAAVKKGLQRFDDSRPPRMTKIEAAVAHLMSVRSVAARFGAPRVEDLEED